MARASLRVRGDVCLPPDVAGELKLNFPLTRAWSKCQIVLSLTGGPYPRAGRSVLVDVHIYEFELRKDFPFIYQVL